MADPHPSVYQPYTTYICGSGGCNTIIDHIALPERHIAGNYLEEIGEWLSALQREGAPRRVLFTLRAAYDAALAWTADLDELRPAESDGTPYRGA